MPKKLGENSESSSQIGRKSGCVVAGGFDVTGFIMLHLCKRIWCCAFFVMTWKKFAQQKSADLTRSLAQQKVEEGNWRRIKMADLTRSLVYARDYFNHYGIGASSLSRPTDHEDPDRDEIGSSSSSNFCYCFCIPWLCKPFCCSRFHLWRWSFVHHLCRALYSINAPLPDYVL